jgi:hypothetical protein
MSEMPFVKDILKYRSVSIAGLEKNTGKTECFNYLIKRLPTDRMTLAVTSIGLDGERVDTVTGTSKPEIILKKGMLFATGEKLYKKRKILSEIVDIGEATGSMGRIITARALATGKIMLSGPTATADLKKWMEMVRYQYKSSLCIIDGALSRMSLASPAVSEAMILTTGAALSVNISNLIIKSSHVVDLIMLPLSDNIAVNRLKTIENGIWSIKIDDTIEEMHISSGLEFDKTSFDILNDCKAIFISGALTDKFLNLLTERMCQNGFELIVKDFTKIFADHRSIFNFNRRGGKISVLQRSNLIAVCVNPVSPNGTILNSEKLCAGLSQSIGLPVYDIKQYGYEA